MSNASESSEPRRTAPQAPPAPPPRRSASSWIYVALLAAAVLFYAIYRVDHQPPTPTEHPAIGQTAPDLDLIPLLDSTPPLEPDDLEHKVVLVHFWATWCGPCRAEYPELVELYDRFAHEERVRWVSISYPAVAGVDAEELRRTTEQYHVKLRAEIPTYADPQTHTGQRFASLLGKNALGLPTTVVVDHHGTVRGVWEGYHPSGVQQMGLMLTSLLEQAPGI